jgi:hypothetical protein
MAKLEGELRVIANHAVPAAVHGTAVGLRYGLIPVQGSGIAVATVARMLDPEGAGIARLLRPEEPIPWGARPVLLTDTTVYGAVRVEQMLREWHSQVPRPWLVLIADCPARPVPAARYRHRALRSRMAGMATVPYLPCLRMVEGPEAAMAFKDVQGAADRLRQRIEGNRT